MLLIRLKCIALFYCTLSWNDPLHFFTFIPMGICRYVVVIGHTLGRFLEWILVLFTSMIYGMTVTTWAKSFLDFSYFYLFLLLDSFITLSIYSLIYLYLSFYRFFIGWYTSVFDLFLVGLAKKDEFEGWGERPAALVYCYYFLNFEGLDWYLM